MKNEIVKKLSLMLEGSSAIDDEIRVIYLLAQVRKILEHERAGATIRFYCNWALHISLDYSAQSFLREILPRLEWGRIDSDTREVADRLLTLRAFREELCSFLVGHDIDPSLCVDDNRWMSFLAAYAKVVHDCPLEVKPEGQRPSSVKPKKKGPLSITTQVNIKMRDGSIKPMAVMLRALRVEALPYTGHLSADQPLPMKWAIEYEERETGLLCKGSLSVSHKGVVSRTFGFGSNRTK